MDRVKFKIQGRTFFSWSLELHVEHMNYGNHLANDKVLTLCHEARVRWLRENNHTELDIDGKALIQADAMIMYKSQGYVGDAIQIDLSLGEFNSKSFSLYYSISNTESGAEIARVKTALLFFDYQTQSITSASSSFLDYLKEIKEREL
ncbi:hypothetical protein BIY24_07740 [Halobacteriovorax marinus]|uniref:acyl-CoA thioesterase n=1 Tax=Halobacteriovorax marinus TaxID=97084 RepID=UPI000BC3534B|nr:thioesterase family protein [Halobacteriovorax marinus]ATH07844.1 hypothetical protein BIY24_07740 [Halobacteriovorax marinus]